jgi:hypothetical protein
LKAGVHNGSPHSPRHAARQGAAFVHQLGEVVRDAVRPVQTQPLPELSGATRTEFILPSLTRDFAAAWICAAVMTLMVMS